MKIVDIIKWDDESAESNNYVVYKHEAEDFNTGSQLIVHQNQYAVFFQNGKATDMFGPGRHPLKSSNLPILGKLVNLATAGETPFHCEVYFVNKVRMTDLGWGTRTPIMASTELYGATHSFRLRANGSFGIHIDDENEGVKKLLEELVGTRSEYTKKDIEGILKGKLLERLNTLLGDAIKNQGADVFNLSSYFTQLSDSMLEQMKPYFKEYGICLDLFSFEALEIDAEDFKMFKKLQDRHLDAVANAMTMNIESEALAMKRAREGYTYAQEHGLEAMKIAAANEGTSGTFMGAGMGLGMGAGMGAAFGTGMTNVAQNAMGGMMAQPNQPAQAEATTCPDCGATLAANAKFCGNCGKKIGNFCPNCGEAIAPNAKFCGNCGQKLTLNCAKCGAELAPGTKFCANCGEKV